MIENVFAKVADEEIIVAVVVVITDAAALSPAGMSDTGFESDVRERAIAIVFEEAGPFTRKMSSQPSLS